MATGFGLEKANYHLEDRGYIYIEIYIFITLSAEISVVFLIFLVCKHSWTLGTMLVDLGAIWYLSSWLIRGGAKSFLYRDIWESYPRNTYCWFSEVITSWQHFAKNFSWCLYHNSLVKKSGQPAYSQIHKWWSSSRASMCSSLQRFFFWYSISTHGPGSEQVLVLSVPPQLRSCLLCLKLYLAPGELRNFTAELFTRTAWFFVFFFWSSFFLCCIFFVAKLDSYKVVFIHLTPKDYIGLGWAPASAGDSWVSPKQSIAICILMKVGHCLSFNVVKWNNYFPTEWPDMAL